MLPYCWDLIKSRIDNREIFDELKIFLRKKEFKKYIIL